jgi:hypothetical protein
MKKTIIALSLVVLLPASWQVWKGWKNELTVYYGGEDSAICYIGTAEDYDGHCVSPEAPTSQYLLKIQESK